MMHLVRRSSIIFSRAKLRTLATLAVMLCYFRAAHTDEPSAQPAWLVNLLKKPHERQTEAAPLFIPASPAERHGLQLVLQDILKRRVGLPATPLEKTEQNSCSGPVLHRLKSICEEACRPSRMLQAAPDGPSAFAAAPATLFAPLLAPTTLPTSLFADLRFDVPDESELAGATNNKRKRNKDETQLEDSRSSHNNSLPPKRRASRASNADALPSKKMAAPDRLTELLPRINKFFNAAVSAGATGINCREDCEDFAKNLFSSVNSAGPLEAGPLAGICSHAGLQKCEFPKLETVKQQLILACTEQTSLDEENGLRT